VKYRKKTRREGDKARRARKRTAKDHEGKGWGGSQADGGWRECPATSVAEGLEGEEGRYQGD